MLEYDGDLFQTLATDAYLCWTIGSTGPIVDDGDSGVPTMRRDTVVIGRRGTVVECPFRGRDRGRTFSLDPPNILNAVFI